jgi:phage-related protein
MATLATLAVKLIGDTSGFSESMSGAAGQTRQFADKFEGEARRIGGLGSIMQGAMSWVTGNVIMKGIDAVVGSLGNLKSGMIDGNAEFERYTVQFGVLLGSTDAAKARLEDLAKFGASTPFELPEVVKADKIIQGFGLHSEESAKKFGFTGEEIRTIAGDTASGAGTSFEEMAAYIGKFSAGATGEVISRFQELGITTREELTKLGLEFDKSGSLLSPLPEATQVVLDLMKKKYGGMMDAQSGTFEGMMSNLNDWVAGTLRTIGQPIFELLKDKLGGVLEFLGSPAVQGAITGFATTLSNGIGAAIAFITPIIDQGIALFTTFADQIDYFVRMVVDGFDTAGPFGAVSNAVYFIADALGLGGDEASAFADNVGAVAEQVGSSINDIIAFVTALWNNITGVFSGSNSFTELFRDWFDAEAVGGFIDGLIGNVRDLVAFAQANLPAFLAAFQSVVGEVVTFVQSNWPTIQAIIETVLTNIAAFIESPLKPALAFAYELFQKIVAAVTEYWPLITPIVSRVLTAIQNIVQVVLPIVRTVFESVFNALKPIVEGALNLVLGVVKSVLQLINGDTAGALQTLKTTFETVFGEVVKFIESLPEKFVSFGRQVIQGFIDGMNQMGEALKAKIYALIPEPVRKILNIASPSKLMHYFGEMSALGFVYGWEDVFDRHPLMYAMNAPQPATPAQDALPNRGMDPNEISRPEASGLTGNAAGGPNGGGGLNGGGTRVELVLDGRALGSVLLEHLNNATQVDVDRYSAP